MTEPLRTPAAIVELALRCLPELIVHNGNLPSTAAAVRDLLAASGRFFDRGIPVRFVHAADGSVPSAVPLARNNVIIEAHRLCQPIKIKPDGERVPVTLPDRVAQMYLDMAGDWHLEPLTGISVSPLLSDDGGIRLAEGYDRETGLWCCRIPAVTIPAVPSTGDAASALQTLRHAFRTFPFADGERIVECTIGLETVDPSKPPAQDESAFLVALVTACCRPSLDLAPALLLSAPSLSGAGTGKGLLVRAICSIAFGSRPRAFTAGNDRHELDKRLAAELVEAQPALFLDNVNGAALRSDTLASVLTERPARVRLLGQTRMVPLNSTAFVAVTGNGVTVSEDLARRFIVCEMNARCENPESRSFPGGFLDDIDRKRPDLLAAVLTIWRWGRQNTAGLRRGRPLGSFERWAAWCRDPLLGLGCSDPVERVESLKARDPQRQNVAELFTAWWEHHGGDVVTVNGLADAVKAIADNQGRGRQYLAHAIGNLAGTYAAGFVLTRQKSTGKWSTATYVLRKAGASNGIGHGGHRDHRPQAAEDLGPERGPMTPMIPMPDDLAELDQVPPGSEAKV
jgi:hypothetical protein